MSAYPKPTPSKKLIKERRYATYLPTLAFDSTKNKYYSERPYYIFQFLYTLFKNYGLYR